jgi:hypothetical protein
MNALKYLVFCAHSAVPNFPTVRNVTIKLPMSKQKKVVSEIEVCAAGIVLTGIPDVHT